MQNTIIYRCLALVLAFPVMLREWFDTLTDIGSFSDNAALTTKIISYQPTEVQTLFDRSIDMPWLGNIAAVFFILMHLLVAVLLTVGMIKFISST